MQMQFQFDGVWMGSRVVCRLMRFNRDGSFNDSVSYEQWMAFYGPLSRDGGGM